MFVVIESVDGGGCQTQAELLAKNLPGSSYMKFPHYDTPVGKMIQEFLYKNKKLNPREQFLLYSMQFIFDSPEIEKKSTDGVLVADRYFTTTLCYQTLEGISEEVALRFARDFEIIVPDLVIFLDVSPDTAMRWKHGENKELNFRETDTDFIKKTYDKYQDLMKRSVWVPWKKINGEQAIELVHADIITIVKEYEKKS